MYMNIGAVITYPRITQLQILLQTLVKLDI